METVALKIANLSQIFFMKYFPKLRSYLHYNNIRCFSGTLHLFILDFHLLHKQMKDIKPRKSNFRTWFLAIILSHFQTLMNFWIWRWANVNLVRQWLQVFKQFLPFPSHLELILTLVKTEHRKEMGPQQEQQYVLHELKAGRQQGHNCIGKPSWFNCCQRLNFQKNEFLFPASKGEDCALCFVFLCQELVPTTSFFPEQVWICPFPCSLAKHLLCFSTSSASNFPC